jgi:uncharacterized protein (TIGR02145 family)
VINPVPNAPGDIATSQQFCLGATVADLEPKGNDITWYDGNTDAANVVAKTTPLVNGATYYATKTLDGCESANSVGVTVEVLDNPAIGTIVTITEPTCTTAGSIHFDVSGGSGNYLYSINGSLFITYTDGNVIGLPAGSVTIDVKDANPVCGGAIARAEFELTNSAQTFSIALTVDKPTDCTSTDGAIHVTLNGGSDPFNYILGTSVIAPPVDGVIGGLAVGEYVVTVVDIGGCSDKKKVVITSDASTLAFFGNYTITPTTCTNATGSITFAVMSDYPSFTYQIDKMVVLTASGTDAITVGGLAAGTHTLYVTDECGAIEYSFTITNSDGNGLSLTATPTDIAHCEGTSKAGSITLTATGGDATSYEYSIDGGTTWTLLPSNPYDLPISKPGNFLIELKDGSGCTFSVSNVVVDEVELCELIACDKTERVVTEDDCDEGYYTHSDNTWDIVPVSGVVFDAVKYIINGTTEISGTGATLNGVQFNVGTNVVKGIAYVGTQIDTCEFKVTVNSLLPTLTSDTDLGIICSGNEVNYIAISSVTPVDISWIRVVVLGISPAGGTKIISNEIHETLLNTTTAPITVTYQIFLVDGDCENTQEVTVIVAPNLDMPTIIIDPLAVVDGTNIDLSDAVDQISGLTYTYYEDADKTKPISGSTILVQFPKTDYYVTASYDNCESPVAVINLKDKNKCPDTVSDTEGNTYKVTSLAGYCWTENLRSTVYFASGDPIKFAKPYTCPSCPAQLDTIFGLLYTWYSAVNEDEPTKGGIVQGICPDDWHIPSIAEWSALNGYPASQLKSTKYWLDPPGSGTDDYGFNALPAGFFNGASNRFEDLYGFTGWWASDDTPGATASFFSISYYCEQIQNELKKKLDGLSVRCVMDK